MYYQITDYFDPVEAKKIVSKCPDCGNSNCLELSFYQKRTESPFGTKTSKKVTGILFCHTTKTEISPVLWTDEIENYFNTEKSKLKLQPSKFKFAKRFYFLLIFLFAIAGVVAFYGIKEYVSASNIANVSEGNMVKVMYSSGVKNSNVNSYGDTWFLVKQIKGDTIWLQRHKDYTNEEGFDFDLNTSNFNKETLKVSLSKFKTRTLSGFDYNTQPFSGIITHIETN